MGSNPTAPTVGFNMVFLAGSHCSGSCPLVWLVRRDQAAATTLLRMREDVSDDIGCSC